MKTQVLIVGAGPVGLTLAIDLGMQGIRCVLVEKKPAPEFLPKMERCNARTMEIYRRLGIVDRIRKAGLNADVPMDVFIIRQMNLPPLLHLPYPSVNGAKAEIAACDDTSEPAEPYQLVSQYTLEPVLKQVAEELPSITLLYDHELEEFREESTGVVTQLRRGDGTICDVSSDFLVGCDGGASSVRKQLGIQLRGEGDILRLRQALYRCDALYDMIPIGPGPGHGRHYHVSDDRSSFLIMQDSTRHWTLHAVVDSDEAMAKQFEKVVGVPVDYEMLYVGEWKQNLLLADRYGEGRVFLAGDSAHLVIPTGGLGMNTGVGDAIDLSWKLAAVLQGWGGPKLLESYEVERRQVGDRNIGASRYASLGRRKWRGAWTPEVGADGPAGDAARARVTTIADVEQRKTNEMIGAELGYRYVDSPVIWDEPGGPEQLFRTYDPTAWTGVRLPHVWLAPGHSINDDLGRCFTLLRMGPDAPEGEEIGAAIRSTGAPFEIRSYRDARIQRLYGARYLLVRPDLHIAWRGNTIPRDLAKLADIVTGRQVDGMARSHGGQRAAIPELAAAESAPARRVRAGGR